MPVFYTIHSLNWGQTLTLGQRNCRTFIYGMCIYVFIYIILKNLQIVGYIKDMYDALYTGLIILFVADIVVMGYLYRNYFGRSIVHEISDEGVNHEWQYNSDTHTYTPKPLEEKLNERLQAKNLIERYNVCDEIISHQVKEQGDQIKAKSKKK